MGYPLLRFGYFGTSKFFSLYNEGMHDALRLMCKNYNTEVSKMYNARIMFTSLLNEIKAVAAIEALGAKWRRRGEWYEVTGMSDELRDTVYELSSRYYAW